MTITATTLAELQSLASSDLAGFYWTAAGTDTPCTLEDHIWGLDRQLRLFPYMVSTFPVVLTATSLTIDGMEAFRDAFIEEAGEDLIYEDSTGFSWNASAPWQCSSIVEAHGQWLNLDLTPSEMGRTWARNLLSQMAD